MNDIRRNNFSASLKKEVKKIQMEINQMAFYSNEMMMILSFYI